MVKKYTDDAFEIKDFGVDYETGKTTIIIKFTDVTQAQNFVDNINEASGNELRTWIIGFIKEIPRSAAQRIFLSLAYDFIFSAI